LYGLLSDSERENRRRTRDEEQRMKDEGWK
jgi:hypothetical protein